MGQVPAERARAHGPVTTRSGVASVNGGDPDQPTLDVVVASGTRTPAELPGSPAPAALPASPIPEPPSPSRTPKKPPASLAPFDVTDVLINRELSWLDFNARVLAQVEDESLPLLERARFLAIASRALDEFFQVRVGGLKQLAAGLESAASDPQGPQAQVRAIRLKVVELYARQARAFLHGLVPHQIG